MNYKKADEVLPAHLLHQVQRYHSKGLLYIPGGHEPRSGWGQKSGARKQLDERNQAILEAFRSGRTIREISEEYYLSESAIRKIIHRKEWL